MLKVDDKKIKIICISIFALLVMIGAWNCDDAFHGFVMARNFANGNGFVYNIGERVNASTCALFDIILGCLYALFGHMEILSFVVCSIYSTLAFTILLFKFCRSRYMPVFMLLVCGASYTFMSYTTAGLENSLLFLLEVSYLVLVLKKEEYSFKELLLISGICSAVLLTRLDAGLLLLLPTAFVFIFKKRCTWLKMLLAGIVGLIPFFAWEVFSVIYYGALFPNTYYAKVTTGLPTIGYLYNGVKYCFVSCLFDAIPLMVILIVTRKLLLSKNWKYITFGVSILAKIIYIVFVGGDFMVGRHFTDVMFFALAIGCYLYESCDDIKYKVKIRNTAFIIMGICIIFTTITSRIMVATMMWPADMFSCADERAYYYPTLGAMPRFIKVVLFNRKIDVGLDYGVENLLNNGVKGDFIDFAGGQIVYKYGEKIYLSDMHGLGDPLLTKLPAIDDGLFRTGHMMREIPDGYRETIATGKNMIVNQDLHTYYDKLQYVIRGDLWSTGRIGEAVKLASGEYDYLLEDYANSLVY